jgi:hypothetical protein
LFSISFFATPTAAGTATPSAAPATTFFVVDMPSSSAADVVSSSLATVTSAVEESYEDSFLRYREVETAISPS